MPFLSIRRTLNAHPCLRRSLRLSAAGIASILLSSCASLDAMRRVEVDFEYVSEIAAERAENAYQAPEPVPEMLMNLDYDEYRKIRYNADSYLWKSEGLPFSLGFFHPGFLHGDRASNGPLDIVFSLGRRAK